MLMSSEDDDNLIADDLRPILPLAKDGDVRWNSFIISTQNNLVGKVKREINRFGE